MISCKQCHTPNSLDSKFCKRCGAEIPADELLEAQAKLDRLLEEGNTLFNQARVDEALAIADAAVLANPSSVTALSLKSLCHERRGEIAEALEAADRIVELHPDSDFDRIRRSTLRQKLQVEFQLGEPPDRRVAYVGAAGAIVLVLCIGVLFARLSNSPARVAENSSAVSPATVANPTTVNPAAPSSQAIPAGNSSGQTQTIDTTNPTAGQTDRRTETDQRADANRDGSGSVPPITRARAVTAESLRPSTDPEAELPIVDGGGASVSPVVPPDPQVKTGTSTGTDPEADKQNPIPAPKTTIETSNADQGTLVIKVHSNPKGSAMRSAAPSGSDSPSGNGMAALVRVGSQQYELGNYSAAARSYEQALESGGDAILLNKRLGQAYQRLGRSGDASEAFRKCISAIDSALAAGRGNRDALMSTRGLCQQELKVLGD